MDAWALSRLDGLGHGVNVLFDATCQRGDHRPADLLGNSFNGRKVSRRGRRKPGLNDVYTQTRELVGNLQFLRSIQTTAWRLFAIAQGRIKNVYFPHDAFSLRCISDTGKLLYEP